ncbi:MAG TPA: hypothetical protein PKN50_03260 [Spirochaetota bacterium]|nr:hypothetical protein [Spirochaetota bacterium]
MKSIRLFLIPMMILSLALAASAQPNDLSLKQGGRDFFSFKKTADGYRATSARLFLDVIKDKTGYRLIMGGKEYLVKEKENAYKIYGTTGSLIYKIKEKENKIKVMKSENDPAPWLLKYKGGHYKVVSGDRDLGKVKFYGDKKKLKVKDRNDNEICQGTADRLYAAPSVVLFEGLKESDMLILFAALSLAVR